MENNYGMCKFCGAKNVKSPKTGKIFCSEKCWLKGEQTPTPTLKPTTSFHPRPLSQDPERLSDIKKAEGQSFGNAKACASRVLAASIASGHKTLEEAMALADEITQAWYDINDKTQTAGN